MALAVESHLRTVIGEVAREHGYDRLKEEQLSAIEKFVSGQDVFVSLPTGVWKIRYQRTSTHNIRSSEGTYSTSIALIVSPLASLMVDQKARSPRSASALRSSDHRY